MANKWNYEAANDIVLSWFPGHMKVALDEIKKVLPLVDAVIEVADARAPFSSINSSLSSLVQSKKRIIVFSKLDLADRSRVNVALDYYKKKGYETFACSFKSPKEVDGLRKYLGTIETPKAKRFEKLGFKRPALRALIVGIPNVGKSTLINALVKRNKASVQNTPGHTKAQQLVKLGNELELFDTPGILQPNYDNKEAILHLAWLGSIKETILPLEDIAYSLGEYMLVHYEDAVRERFSLEGELNYSNLFDKIAESRKYLLAHNTLDVTRAMQTFVKEVRDGLVCKVVVDDVEA